MRDIERIRESFEHEADALDDDVVIVVTETFHPPCSCHSSHTETFGVFANPSALSARMGGVGRRRQVDMSARVERLQR